METPFRFQFPLISKLLKVHLQEEQLALAKYLVIVKGESWRGVLFHANILSSEIRLKRLSKDRRCDLQRHFSAFYEVMPKNSPMTIYFGAQSELLFHPDQVAQFIPTSASLQDWPSRPSGHEIQK